MSTYKIELKSSKRECKCRGTCKGIIHEARLRRRTSSALRGIFSRTTFKLTEPPPIILPQDELRIASISDPAEGHSVAYWKHLACMTKTVVSSQARPTSSTSRPRFPPFQTRYHD